MIYITSSAIVDDKNNFKVRSIYIASIDSSWVLTEGMNWEPQKHTLSLASLKALVSNQKFTTSQIVYSPIRVLDTEDAKSFATFMKEKLRRSVSSEFNKKLFILMSEGLGEEYKW